MKNNDIYMVFYSRKVLMKKQGEKYIFPRYKELIDLNIKTNNYIDVGLLDDIPCFAIEIYENINFGENFILLDLRTLGLLFGENIFYFVGRAYQLLEFENYYKYCSKCGSSLLNHEEERAKVCTNCGLIHYPRISPAIIVAKLAS